MFKHLLSGIYYLLHPRPVVLISSTYNDETDFMAASWITPISAEPPIIAVSISPRRYTYKLIIKSREFAVTVLPVKYVNEIHTLGTISLRNMKNKLNLIKLKLKKCKKVRTYTFEEAVAFMECKVTNVISSGDHDLILGHVINAEIRENISPGDPASYEIPLHVGKNVYTSPSTKTIVIGE